MLIYLISSMLIALLYDQYLIRCKGKKVVATKNTLFTETWVRDDPEEPVPE